MSNVALGIQYRNGVPAPVVSQIGNVVTVVSSLDADGNASADIGYSSPLNADDDRFSSGGLPVEFHQKSGDKTTLPGTGTNYEELYLDGDSDEIALPVALEQVTVLTARINLSDATLSNFYAEKFVWDLHFLDTGTQTVRLVYEDSGGEVEDSASISQVVAGPRSGYNFRVDISDIATSPKMKILLQDTSGTSRIARVKLSWEKPEVWS